MLAAQTTTRQTSETIVPRDSVLRFFRVSKLFIACCEFFVVCSLVMVLCILFTFSLVIKPLYKTTVNKARVIQKNTRIVVAEQHEKKRPHDEIMRPKTHPELVLTRHGSRSVRCRLPIRLRCYTKIGAHGHIPFREFFLEYGGILKAGRNNHVFAHLPVYRRRHTVIVGKLK